MESAAQRLIERDNLGELIADFDEANGPADPEAVAARRAKPTCSPSTGAGTGASQRSHQSHICIGDGGDGDQRRSGGRVEHARRPVEDQSAMHRTTARGRQAIDHERRDTALISTCRIH